MATTEEKESTVFKPVSPRVSFPKMEEEVLAFWKETDILRRIDRAREGAPLFTLFEGPPTANGAPGIHHVLARVFKDVIPRYKTMKGYRPVRKGGWDTHGLPVELEIEKELGISTKGEIEEYGIEKFNALCRDSVMRYVQEWEIPHRPHSLPGGHGRPLRHLHQRLHRVRLVDSQGALGHGAAVPGIPGSASLSAL